MKRTASAAAVLLTALLLTSCSTGISSNYGSSTTSSNISIVVNGNSGGKVDTNAQIKPGSINNGYSYTSKYLGVFIRFVSGWEFKTEKELKEANGVEAFNDFAFGLNTAVKSNGEAIDLDATRTETGANVKLIYKLLPEASYNITASEYLTERLAKIEETAAASGGIYHGAMGSVAILPEDNSFLDVDYTTLQNHSCLDLTVEEPDGTVTYQKLIALKKDIFMGEILLTASSESEMEELVEMLESVSLS